MRLFHATKISNKDGIKRVGLKLNRVSSGYGKTPTHNAVYLYCIYNVDVACDMIDLFGEIAVFEIVNIDKNKLIPDEDSGEKSWKDSIEKMGTCAYTEEIPARDLKYIGSFNSENEYISWAEMERLIRKP